MSQPVSPVDPFPRRRQPVLESTLAFVDEGVGDPIVFLHGNPTSSYLWRNIIPHLKPFGRCLAPDLIGMGQSGHNPGGSYRFADHARYLDAWFDRLEIEENVVLVVHDWGSALGFDWACRHRARVQGIVYMEAIVKPLRWDEWPEAGVNIFRLLRSPVGEELILERNLFVERILPASILRPLDETTLAAYRAPFLSQGESRRPMLTWPREIPFDNEPADVAAVVERYSAWLAGDATLPKLFINADPGSILTGPQRDFCRTWPNQREVIVPGLHFIQEDAPDAIGAAAAQFVRALRGVEEPA